MVHDPAHAEQDQVADEHERAVLAEAAVGLIHDHAHERVGDAVPDTHDHRERAREHNADTDETGQVVGDVADDQQVEVGGGVVERITADAPDRYAVDTVRPIIVAF